MTSDLKWSADADVSRCWYPESGHGPAVNSSPSRLDRLSEVGAPTLVVHGDRDPEAPVKEHFAGEKGLALLADDPTASFDCISTFNPTRQAEYEKVVAAWTDALLVLVNQSTVPL